MRNSGSNRNKCLQKETITLASSGFRSNLKRSIMKKDISEKIEFTKKSFKNALKRRQKKTKKKIKI